MTTNGLTRNSIGYTGQRLDAETGLMALGNGERYYSPTLARFIQQDSFAGVGSLPQSLNRFAYTHNNPNKYTDPTGNAIPVVLAAVLIGMAVGAVVGAAFGAAYSITKQQAEIADGIRHADQFSWSEVGWEALKGAGFGALMGGLYATGPIGAAIVIGSGVILSSYQIYEGFNQRAAGHTYSGNTDIAFGVLGLLLAAKGAKDSLAGMSAKVKEAEFGGTKTAIGEETGQTPKLLTDGGTQERISSGKLLNAAPDETATAIGRIQNQLAKYGSDIAELRSIIGEADTSTMMRNLRQSEMVGMAESNQPPKLLKGAGETSRTLQQVKNLRGTNQERGNALRDFVAEAYETQTIEVHESTKLGSRYHDVAVQQGELSLRIETKNYLEYYFRNGNLIQNKIDLTPSLHKQIHKDVLWRRAGNKIGESRLIQWHFNGALPSEKLRKTLEFWNIPYVH